MPVARSRGTNSRVDYVVVRRSGVDVEEEVNGLGAFESTPLASVIKRQIEVPKFRIDTASYAAADAEADGDLSDDSDDEDDDVQPSPTGTNDPPSVTITMTMPVTDSTGGALPNTNPTDTVVVEFPPPPPPPPPKEKGGISQTTEHLLIAAGSIGATIIIVMVILGIYTMRKRGLSFSEATRQVKNKIMGRRPAPPPKQKAGWLDSKSGAMPDYGAMRSNTVTPPQRAASIPRSGSISSQRPVMAMQRSDSFNNRQIPQASSPHQSSFLLQSPPPGRNNSHRRQASTTPSSPVLPLQTSRRSASTHNTHSMSEVSELKFPAPANERSLSPLPPPPTFKQFLSNRPSASQKNSGFGNMVSRFSWTNSNAPQTPHDPTRDTNTHNIGRDSFMTQRSSVPRFRTVDSWVNQQANRVEAQKLKEQFRLTQASTVYSSDDELTSTVPSVPMIPQNHNNQQLPPIPQARELTNTSMTSTLPPPVPPSGGGLPGKNIKHERHDTRTTVETAPIFRQHPGTEVRFSTRSEVPSEILDMGARPNVLS